MENELKVFQDIVGGYIECIGCPACEEIDLVCNEEGKLEKLDGNFFVPEYEDCLVGTTFAVGYNDEGDWISITDEQAKKVEEYMNKYELKENENLYEDFYKIVNRINLIKQESEQE